jgi:hypothetical protein
MKNRAIIKDFFKSILAQLRNGSGQLKLLLVIFLLNGSAVFAQVGVHTDFPDASSAMEIYALNKGLLIPRVTLTGDLSDPSPVTSPANGLLVFNSGANQAIGFYYWNESLSSWFLIGGGSSPGGDFWSLTGNTGTIVDNNFIGTLDDQDFALYTNESERMRITSAGNIVIGNTAPYNASDLFTVVGKPGLDYTINAYSPYIGFYSESAGRGFQSFGGRYGLRAELDSATGFAVYARNFDPGGYGLVTAGSNMSPSYYSGRSAGISSLGNDGIHAYGQSTSAGIGIMAAGNGLTPVALPDGFGGTFIGNVGAYARSSNAAASGTGIIGVGNNLTSSYYLVTGSGGAFTGRDGIFGKSINASGTGVIGLGNNIASPSTISTGTGGAFAGNDGVYGRGVNASTGIGVIGLGSNSSTYPSVTGGCGGAFNGNHGVVGLGTNGTNGTGVIGAGNNGGYTVSSGGSGGAFTGVPLGVIGVGTDATSGIGVIGAGNNAAPSTPTGSIGCGGAFTGTTCGAYGYATGSANGTYGGYFSNGGGTSYAYVGYRVSNQNRKIVGNGTASTIVKNTKGEIVIMACPEAPETLFQDYGIGRLVDGKAHISIDPDLAININVSEEYPLKVYITPEGDCNGVYVTNKSAQGFDVIELQGGISNVSFSWQIVATRANEVYTLKDGTTEFSDYSQRFPPAPGPLEMTEQPLQTVQTNSFNAIEQEKANSDKEKPKIGETVTGELHEATDVSVIEIIQDEKNDK